MYTHATISMNNTHTNTNTNKHTTIKSNKFIDQHCSRQKFDTKLVQCKLTTVINKKLKLSKASRSLIVDFYSATTIKERDTALYSIVNSDNFLQENADLLYRYVDGSYWLKPDFDRVVIGYYVTREKAKEISQKFSLDSLPKGWKAKRLDIKENYKNKWELRLPCGNKIRLFFNNQRNQLSFRHIKIDLSPSYFSDKELISFFSWFNAQLGSERDDAIRESVIASMENGLQLHQVFTPLVVHRNLIGKEQKFQWEIRGEQQGFNQASYDAFLSECDSNITNKIYCPVSKLYNLIFNNRSYTQSDARTLIENISHAARLESSYKYSFKKKAKEYPLSELENVPNFLSKFDLVAPDSYLYLGSKPRTRLMKERIINESNKMMTRSIALSSSMLEPKRIAMLKHYKEIFLI